MNEFEKAAAEPFKPHQCMYWTEGRRCRQFAMHNEFFCYRHRPDPVVQIVPSEPFSLPPFLTDRAQIQAALGELLSRIAAKTIDDKRAGLALYTLQNAISNLSAPARRLPRILDATPLRRRRRLRSFHWRPVPPHLTTASNLIKPDPYIPHSEDQTQPASYVAEVTRP